MTSHLTGDGAAAFLAAIVDSSDDAIIGKALDGTVLSWNGGAERVFGWKAAEIVGRSIRMLIPDDRQDEEDAILLRVGAGQRVPTFETVRHRKDGSPVMIAVTVSPVRDDTGRIVAASKIARDIGETRRVHAELESSELRFRMLADNISQLAWMADHAGDVWWYNQRFFDYTGTTPEEMQSRGWGIVHHADYLDHVTARWHEHLASEQPWEDIFPLRGADGSYRWFLSRAVPTRDQAGQIAHWCGTNTDITEMRHAEERIELLMMEVNHRSKNMLAVILALARRTAAQGGDFVGRLEARIKAIAANQDLLVHRSWSSVPVREMIDAQLPVVGEAALQIERVGPDVMLSPAAAETIAMAIHEMAVNSLQHGALTNADGRVRIAWSCEAGGPGDPGRQFCMSWSETGGPVTRPPEKRGFGLRIIGDVPRGKLSAEITIDFAAEGFRWSLCCPAENVMSTNAAQSGSPLRLVGTRE